MAVAKKNRFYQRPGFRIGVILSSVVLVLSLLVFAFWLTTKSLFSKNANLVIRRVVVRSGGWWRKHPREVNKALGVVPGETNLFTYSLPELRGRLEKRPSVESVEISRIIPDTLLVDINERIPLAFLYWRESKKVVDPSGVVMSTSSCVSIGGDLPVVTGFKSRKQDLIPGSRLPQLLPALRLIDSAAKIVPEARFLRVSGHNPKYFKITMRIDGSKRILTLYMSKKGVEVKLRVLAKLLPRIPSSHPNATVIDMRYKGQAVVE
ncbi:MAG: FtsQ-type POTRA domain-containing protein [Kiritimatiellaeota bacterium]|nr:FtsQ-type POTRA domain-containing protein [Kiritimatiellota bacterium]